MKLAGKPKRLLNKVKKAVYIIFHLWNLYFYKKDLYMFHNLSFSQEGEDRILARLFESYKTGFFVDIGAHHPQRFSNTYFFYLKGWRGINIDAKPGSMEIFNKIRPRDINLERAISNEKTELMYYEFNEPALNGFEKNISEERNGLNSYKIIKNYKVQTYTLKEILDDYLPEGQFIDFLSIDVEGLDFEVLQSNDWDKYLPYIILIEDLNLQSLENAKNSEVVMFLRQRGYFLIGKTGFTLIFKKFNND